MAPRPPALRRVHRLLEILVLIQILMLRLISGVVVSILASLRLRGALRLLRLIRPEVRAQALRFVYLASVGSVRAGVRGGQALCIGDYLVGSSVGISVNRK